MTQPKSTKQKRASKPASRRAGPDSAALSPTQAKPSSPKFVTLSPLTIRLRHDQVVLLTDMEQKIMRQRERGQRRERITKSTIVRALIDLLPELLTDTQGIADEGTLSERLRMLSVK